jgi:uncharacterized protein (UPF0335 family)
MKNKEIENILDKCAPYLFGDELDKLLSYIEQLEKENQQLKKQKDDVVEYIKYNATSNYFDKDKNMFRREIDLLRMLGETDEIR